VVEGAVASLRSGAFLGIWAVARGLEGAATLLRYSATGLLRRADLRRAAVRQWREWNVRYEAEHDKFAPLSWESDFYTRCVLVARHWGLISWKSCGRFWLTVWR